MLESHRMSLPPDGPAGPGNSPADGRGRVEVENPSDGGFVYWLLKFYAFGAVTALGLLGLTSVIIYFYFASTLPALPDLAT